MTEKEKYGLEEQFRQDLQYGSSDEEEETTLVPSAASTGAGP